MNNAAIKTSLCFMWIYVLISHEYIFQRGIIWSYDNSLYNFMRNCQTLFQSCCHILHSNLQLMKGFHFFPHSCQHFLLFFLVFFFFLITSILVRCEKIPWIWGTSYLQIMLLSIFMCLLAMCISTFFFFLLLSCKSFYII